MPLLLSEGLGSHLQFPREPERYHSKLDPEKRKMGGTFDSEKTREHRHSLRTSRITGKKSPWALGLSKCTARDCEAGDTVLLLSVCYWDSWDSDLENMRHTSKANKVLSGHLTSSLNFP